MSYSETLAGTNTFQSRASVARAFIQLLLDTTTDDISLPVKTQHDFLLLVIAFCEVSS